MSQIDPGLSPLSDEQRSRLRALAWSTLRKFVLSATGAIGVKLGEHIVEWFVDGDESGDDDSDGEA